MPPKRSPTKRDTRSDSHRDVESSPSKMAPKTPAAGNIKSETGAETGSTICEEKTPEQQMEIDDEANMDAIVSGMHTMGLKRGNSGRSSIEGGAILNSPYNSPRSTVRMNAAQYMGGSPKDASSWFDREIDDAGDTPAAKRSAAHATPVAVKTERDAAGAGGPAQPKAVDTPKDALVLKLRKPANADGGDGVFSFSAGATEASAGQQAQKKVLVICSNSHLGSDGGGDEDHNTGMHQENARRTELLVGADGCLRRKALSDSMVWAPPVKYFPAPMSDLLRVHEYAYLRHLQDKCNREEVSFGKPSHVSSSSGHASPNEYLDSDTPLGPLSLSAARRFCGAAMYAVDCAYGEAEPFPEEKVHSSGSRNPGIDRVFVLGRPPGHHAGPNGCVAPPTFWRRPEMTSSGFCLLNTAVVAAAYARQKYGRQALNQSALGSSGCVLGDRVLPKPRIAIIDIDIHHGNGTEACVRNLTPSMQQVPLPSSWAPVYQQSYKPWLDDDDNKETFFGSVHLFQGEHFYPGTGSDCCEKVDPETGEGANICNVTLTPVGPGPCDVAARNKLSGVQRTVCCDAASEEMKRKLEETLFPALAEFKPTLVIISSGFDAHFDDMYHYLREQDYHWMTDRLCEIAETANRGEAMSGRVISVLEGGYSLSTAIPAPRKSKKGVEQEASEKPPKPPGSDPLTKFAQQQGDGGLVKSVLAHVAALSGRDHWD